MPQEAPETDGGISGAARGQYLLAIAGAEGGVVGVAVGVEAGVGELLEEGGGVDLGPEVAVIPAVVAAEEMAKVGEGVGVGGLWDEGDAGAELVPQLLGGLGAEGAAVEGLVEVAEEGLAEVEQPRVEVLELDEALDDAVGQRLSRLVVAGEALEHGRLVAPLLEHLAGALHKVPLRVGAGHARVLGGAEEHVTLVPELVQQRHHL